LFKPALIMAALSVALATGTGATATASSAAAPRAAAPARPAAAAPASQAVFLPTGQLVTTGAHGISVLGNEGGPLQSLSMGGQSYLLPLTAEPYLGHGLDPGLFEPGRLARAESGGRLPIQVTCTGRAPHLPGMTVTSSGPGLAKGYLTAAGAIRFGNALGRLSAADHQAASYGQNGFFTGGVAVTLAGDTSHSAREAAPLPQAATHTLTVQGTDLAGKPDNGDSALVVDADNASLLPRFRDVGEFHHGVVTFSVPAGHFWVQAIFYQGSALSGTTHLDVLPEITVTGDTTVATSARAASSRLHFMTPRPATVRSWIFTMIFQTYQAPAGCCTLESGFIAAATPPGSLYVTPMLDRPGVGALTEITSAELASPPGARRLPYEYSLAYQAQGVIPAQRFVAGQADLATENAEFYSAVPQTGYLGAYSWFPIERRLGSEAVLWPAASPQQLIMYFTANRSLAWSTQDVLWGRVVNFAGGYTSPPQVFLPGQRLTDPWGAYPLHPAPAVRLTTAGDNGPVTTSASRSGDELGLDLAAFGDNTPGHAAWSINPPFKPAGSYQLDQNGTEIAGGTLSHFHGYAEVAAALSPARSRVTFVLNAAEPTTLSPLSASSQTTWSWWSSPEPGATLPQGWRCTVRSVRDCAVQPLLTLRYGVTGMNLSGTAPAGQQVVRLVVGHVQLAQAAAVTGAHVAVSFDGGQIWTQARMTGRGDSYAAVFDAPAGAQVTLKTIATDAAGGSITQTITDAYQSGTPASP
jgi:hypothetical protein